MTKPVVIISIIVIVFFSALLLLKYGDSINMAFFSQLEFMKGYNLSKNKDYINAIERYRKAIEINPGIYYVYQNIGVIFQKQGKYDEAIREYGLELKNNPGNREVRKVLIALKEYQAQLGVYNGITPLIEGVREYTKLNNRLIELIYDIKQDYSKIKENEIKDFLAEIKANYISCKDKLKNVNVNNEKIEAIKSSLISAFDRRIGVIDYLWDNPIKPINYINSEKECIARIKEADLYLIDVFKKTKGLLKNIYMVSCIDLEREINSSLFYYSSYLKKLKG